MAITFQTMDEAVGLNTGVKIVVYGPAKIGKTVLAGTMPEPILFVNAENGMLSLSPKNQKKIFGREIDITPMKIESYKDLNELHKALLSSKDYQHFRSVVIDSQTEVAEQILAKMQDSNADGRAAYGDMQRQVGKLFRQFRDLPYHHILFTAQMDREKDEHSGRVMFFPSMPGKNITNKAPYCFDEIFYMGQGEDAKTGDSWRYLRCQQDLQFSAGDRSGSLDEIEPPDLTHIINKIQSNE